MLNIKEQIIVALKSPLFIITTIICLLIIIACYTFYYIIPFEALSLTPYNWTYDEFDFLHDRKNLYYYGDINNYDIRSILLRISKIYPNAFHKFLNENGVIIFTENVHTVMHKFTPILRFMPLHKNEIDYSHGGFFTIKNKRPVICINLRIPDVIVPIELIFTHKFGHYIDRKKNYSKTKKFKTFYKKHAKDYKTPCKACEGNHKKSKEEFFAVLFTDLTLYPNDSNDIPRDLKNYMQQVFDDFNNYATCE